MQDLLSVSFGELFLKGKNRNKFFKAAIDNIKRNIEKIGYEDMYLESSKLYIKADKNDFKDLIKEIKKVFGIIYISEIKRCDKDINSIENALKEILDNMDIKNKSFKVITNRVDKSFNIKSPDLSQMMGAYILKNYAQKNNLKVDVHNPDFKVFIDIKKYAYVYANRHEGIGGLPLGSSGNGLLLLSGGIDSPVAGFMMAKRGMRINCLHFHSYPFTSKRALQKAIDLGKILSQYTGKMRIYSVNMAEIYKSINKNCHRNQTTILSRRFMMRIAEKISEKNNYHALITGESLGQVASQTVESMTVIEDATKLPIFKPLIALDKTEIIDRALFIGSYEKSIEPFDDCCSIFAPSNPITKPKLKYIKESESKLDIEELENKAIENMEIFDI
ncbi:tRNA uracil 4-sulfurtransferase ThiI [Anaerococcus hydrogenalis]|uniref:Probable tRNA sulfurtransferase n=1 Tax=Anaerococcus hydrogenalis TaxID=33029 RepID=A0A2N6UL73_9FIRM|nr:tRNA uracil 4-sulfurtransferase ThiI [Anaerococcus hydrogenalis]MDK7694525.1 tRNA uracil 4-sulfurtransferase ThiI [Anaerococcus hydrogenalis]MDK7696303.1 tRNA uracil 4-sulfurtransferase ThiI [Anaerococcus hydrogenalis]MDK7707552.1 tRNA uracil 4-sulfurtransferase ThiI [Anaerococcus hydrogenalis]PMC82565.1 tRNA 4-thiouridine(8) synthase ThiI [Anaerococcus hydrogenalis]